MKQTTKALIGICIQIAVFLFAAGSHAAIPAQLRGNDYVTVDTVTPRTFLYPPICFSAEATTFDPDTYSTATVTADLNEMRSVGYNCVRSFLGSRWNEPGKVGSGQRLNPKLIENTVDFVQRARDRGFFVVFSFGFVPTSYYDQIDDVCDPASPIYDPTYSIQPITVPNDPSTTYTYAACPYAEGYNLLFVHKGVVRAQVQLVSDMLDAMSAIDATLVAQGAFAIEIMNEPYFDSECLPFSITDGTLTVTLDQARTYNMDVTDPANDRQLLADNMLRYWLNHTIPAIKARYPSVPVIVSTFTPYTTGRSLATGFCNPNGSGFTGVLNYPILPDKRQPMRATVINESAADIISVHGSPIPLGAPTYDMSHDMRSAEIDQLTTTTKRLIIGEFWVPRQWFPTIESAASNAVSFQMQSVAWGFSGWMFWNWKASDWSACDSDRSIHNMLSPLFRPDPSKNADVRIIHPVSASTWYYGMNAEIEWMSNIATAGNNFTFSLAFDGEQKIDLGSGQGYGGRGRKTVQLPVTHADVNAFRATSVTRPDLLAEVPLTLDAKTSASKWFLYR